MWRASLKGSKNVILRRFINDWENCDEHGNPSRRKEEIALTAEVYPYSNPIDRQAAGIQSEAAYTVIYAGLAPPSDSLLLMDGKAFRMVSISDYEPVQLVVADTGRPAEETENG